MACVLGGLAMLAGCGKTVDLTVCNHSAQPAELRLAEPQAGVRNIGRVDGLGGCKTVRLSLPEDTLPADCSLTAGLTSTQTFTVGKDTPDALWFHIASDGRLAGPYREPGVFVEAGDCRRLPRTGPDLMTR